MQREVFLAVCTNGRAYATMLHLSSSSSSSVLWL